GGPRGAGGRPQETKSGGRRGEGSGRQGALHASAPPVTPGPPQRPPPRSPPSHCSLPLIVPLPQAMQPLASTWHWVHASFPRANPSEAHVASRGGTPSHSSPASTVPSPQSVARVTMALALLAGDGTRRPRQSTRFVPDAETRSSERASGPMASRAPKPPVLPVNPP